MLALLTSASSNTATEFFEYGNRVPSVKCSVICRTGTADLSLQEFTLVCLAAIARIAHVRASVSFCSARLNICDHNPHHEPRVASSVVELLAQVHYHLGAVTKIR